MKRLWAWLRSLLFGKDAASIARVPAVVDGRRVYVVVERRVWVLDRSYQGPPSRHDAIASPGGGCWRLLPPGRWAVHTYVHSLEDLAKQ